MNGTIKQFEPTPPGAPRPPWLNWIGITDFRLYQPAGAGPRLLVSESFGYQVVDLTNPANPVALKFEDYRFSPSNPGPVPCNGDCHGSISSQAISEDGARVVFGLVASQSSPYSTVVGQPDPSGLGFALTGDMLPNNSTVAVQKVLGRYLAYSTDGINLYVSDVTSPGGLSGPNSLRAERTAFPGGYQLVVSGNKVVYRTGTSIQVLDASNPGPVGAISASFGQTTVNVSDWGRPLGEAPAFFTVAADPGDATKLYVLAEFADSLGGGAGYSLMLIQQGVKTNLGEFRIPAQSGEKWGKVASSGLQVSGGNLFALMWAHRDNPSNLYRLYSAPVRAWGAQTPTSFDVPTLSFPNFSVTGGVQGFAAADGTQYTYVAGGTTGWMLPLSCVSPDSPPASDFTVEPDPCPGASPCPLSANATVFVGQKLKIVPLVTYWKTITDWRFDFDFHASEDNGSSPRVRNADLGYPAAVPATIALYGPCDQRSGGAPATGAGCWASEAANGDFASGAPAGTSATLSLALETANVNGYGNLKTLPLLWKVPAVRLQNPNVLLGQPLVSGAEGTPLPAGFKWYFGSSPTSLTLSACSGPSCAPPAPYNAKGTYYFWLTVPYPTGYTSPDCGSPCTRNLGTYSFTDVSLSFTGIPSTAVAGAGLNVTDASSAAAGATACAGGLEYAFCDASAGACAASSWLPLAISPLGSGHSTTISSPSSAGTYWLRIRDTYTTTGSCASPLVASWKPGVASDQSAWPIVVASLPPTIQVLVNGANPCAGAGGACSGGMPANIGDTITVKAWLGFNADSNPPAATAWSFGPGASPSSCNGVSCQGTTFKYTGGGPQTITLSGYPGIPNPPTVLMSVSVPPVSASNSTPPSGACAGSSVTLTAFPTITGATYVWTGPNGFTSTQQNPVINPAATGTYIVTRQPSSTASTTVVILASPAVPTAGSNAPVCAGQKLSLTAATVAGATYAWTGPNGFASAQQNPSLLGATAAATGTYTVTATVNGCTSAASTGVTVNVPPSAPAAGNNGPVCGGGTLDLTAVTIANATYAWTGPNGFTSALQNPSIPNATAAAGGVYSVTATVNGCTGPSGSTNAVVNGPSASITAPSRICLLGGNTGTASVPNAGTGATYAWWITNGAITGGQGTASISFTVAAAGPAALGVTVTAGGCAPTGSVTIPVQTQCGGLSTLTPCRAVDTRNVSAPQFQANGLRSFSFLSACGIPSTAKAVSANITVVAPTASGALHVYPGNLGTVPSATAISFPSGRTRANNAILSLATDGSGTIAIQSDSAGPLDLVIDVNGYFD